MNQKALHITFLIDKYNSYQQSHDFNNALKVAKELVNLRGHADDWLMQGFCYIAHGKVEEAYLSFRQAIELDPKNDIAWTNAGVILEHLGFYQTGLEILEYALLLKPDNLEALFNKGRILSNLGCHDEALEIFNKVIEIKSDFQIAWTNRGLALSKLGSYEEAWKSFDKAIELDASDVDALQSQAYILANLEKFDEALSFFDRAVELNPVNAEAWLGHGMSLTNLERFDEALNSLNKVVELESNNTEAWYGKSLVLRELQRYEEALSACEKSIELGLKTASVILNNSLILLALNRLPEGLKMLDKAFSLLIHEAGELDSRETEIIINNLLSQFKENKISKFQIRVLIKIYMRYQSTQLLEQELIQSISRIFSSHFNLETAVQWRDIWLELASDFTEFKTYLRFLDAAVRYRQTKGHPSIFMEFFGEELDLFQSLMGVEKTSEPLNEVDLYQRAAYFAYTAHKLYGRGIVLFDREHPEFMLRNENMLPELLIEVDDYDMDTNFLMITSDYSIVLFVEFKKVGIELNFLKEYEKKLDNVLKIVKKQGITLEEVKKIREIIFTTFINEFNEASVLRESIAIILNFLEALTSRNI